MEFKSPPKFPLEMSNNNLAHAISGAVGGIISLTITFPLVSISTRISVDSTNKSSLYSGLFSALIGVSFTQAVYYYSYESIKSKLPARILLASSSAGIITCIVTNPIWVINTKQTVDKSLEKLSILDTIKQIYKESGLKGFYTGIVPAFILVSNPIIQYSVYERLLDKLKEIKSPTTFDFFILGAISKLIATFCTYPYIVLKSKMQVEESKLKFLNFVLKVLKDQGVAGFYKGIEAKLVQSVLTSALLFATKEKVFEVVVKVLKLIKI